MRSGTGVVRSRGPVPVAQAISTINAASLAARGDLELAEDVRQVGVDRARRHEQLLGDLAAGEPLGHELGDAAFGLGQHPQR